MISKVPVQKSETFKLSLGLQQHRSLEMLASG